MGVGFILRGFAGLAILRLYNVIQSPSEGRLCSLYTDLGGYSKFKCNAVYVDFFPVRTAAEIYFVP